MSRDRADQQVLTSARQMDTASTAGLPVEQLAVLVAARHDWQSTGVIPTDPTLATAVSDPRAGEWDAVFVHAARKLSAHRPNVTP